MTRHQENWQASDQDYRTFLLRCWLETGLDDDDQSNESCSWRFALARLDTHEKQGFASLDELLGFLSGEFGNP